MARPTYFMPGHIEGLELEGPWFGTTPPSRSPVYTVTNYTSDRTYDANTAAVAETNDVLATLIRDLIDQGLLKGSVA